MGTEGVCKLLFIVIICFEAATIYNPTAEQKLVGGAKRASTLMKMLGLKFRYCKFICCDTMFVFYSKQTKHRTDDVHDIKEKYRNDERKTNEC